jgi:hypothetical protein
VQNVSHSNSNSNGCLIRIYSFVLNILFVYYILGTEGIFYYDNNTVSDVVGASSAIYMGGSSGPTSYSFTNNVFKNITVGQSGGTALYLNWGSGRMLNILKSNFSDLVCSGGSGGCETTYFNYYNDKYKYSYIFVNKIKYVIFIYIHRSNLFIRSNSLHFELLFQEHIRIRNRWICSICRFKHRFLLNNIYLCIIFFFFIFRIRKFIC